MVVYVLNRDSRPLMPTTPRKARILLKTGKAQVVKRTPFTIRLHFGSYGYTQPVTLGMDSGYTHIGVSAVSDQQELYASDVALRSDLVDLNAERRAYRRARRHRKTRYRKPRFLNRVATKKKGWLAPSIDHKYRSHLKVISRVTQILPVAKIVVEVASFDIQKIKDPALSGSQYQHGDQTGFWNVREYVLHRDGHRCVACKGKSKDPILNVHHRVSRKTGGDRPDNLVTLCRTCHRKHHLGQLPLKLTPSQGFKAETFMSTVRWRLVNALKAQFKQTTPTYGYLTKYHRVRLGLRKSHITDAFVIAGGTTQKRFFGYFAQKQVRKQNRKLFKGIRSHLRNTAPRFIRGFQRYDKVLWQNRACFVFGRRASGYFDLRDLWGTRVCASAKVSDLRLLESSQTMLTQLAIASPLPS